MFDAIFILYRVYMVLAIWGVASLFRSYICLTGASKALTQPKAE
jgi:hypothetical protein